MSAEVLPQPEKFVEVRFNLGINERKKVQVVILALCHDSEDTLGTFLSVRTPCHKPRIFFARPSSVHYFHFCSHRKLSIVYEKTMKVSSLLLAALIADSFTLPVVTGQGMCHSQSNYNWEMPILFLTFHIFRPFPPLPYLSAGLSDSIGATCGDVEGSLTCEECPACDQAICSDEPIPLPPKSPYWPPTNILHRGGPDPIPADLQAEYDWFVSTVLEPLPSAVKQPDTKYALTAEEEKMVRMSLPEWQTARMEGEYTCVEIANALIKRAMYLQDIQKMNHFMYWKPFEDDDDSTAVERNTVFDWTAVVRKQAEDLDAKAEAEGTEAIAPLYCYPVPLKGTMVTKDFPSSAGFAVLQDKFGVIDADLVQLIKDANGVQFGKTNVPELAHSWGTGNYANGLTFNPWSYDDMTGGSSGGSGAAVAAYTATIAVTEDTSGSTNTPAARNHLFGYGKLRY